MITINVNGTPRQVVPNATLRPRQWAILYALRMLSIAVVLLLLALACFARSSEKFYIWLLNHNRLGPIVRPYLENEGLPPGVKFKAISLIWTSIGISVLSLVPLLWVKVMLLLIALGVTGYIVKMPVRSDEESNE